MPGSSVPACLPAHALPCLIAQRTLLQLLRVKHDPFCHYVPTSYVAYVAAGNPVEQDVWAAALQRASLSNLLDVLLYTLDGPRAFCYSSRGVLQWSDLQPLCSMAMTAPLQTQQLLDIAYLVVQQPFCLGGSTDSPAAVRTVMDLMWAATGTMPSFIAAAVKRLTLCQASQLFGAWANQTGTFAGMQQMQQWLVGGVEGTYVLYQGRGGEGG
jgi:hypothetical protein